VNQNMSIDDIQDFGRKIFSLGREYSAKSLLEWGKKVIAGAELFDVKALYKYLDYFPQLIHKMETGKEC